MLGEYSVLLDYELVNFELTCNAKSAENFSQNAYADYTIVYGWIDNQNYYSVMFNRMKGYTCISQFNDGEKHELASYKDFTFKDNDYHQVKVVQNGNYTIVFFDGEQIMFANTGSYVSGLVGVGSYNDAAFFDDIELDYPQGPYVVELTSPNGNEVWEVGTRYPITWKSDTQSGEVYIDISTTGGDSWWDITKGYGTPNDGQYSYQPTNENISAHCLFKVRAKSVDFANDQSDGEFIIIDNIKNYTANHIPYGVSPPTIDGSLNDAAWNYANAGMDLHTGGIEGDYMVPWGNFTDNDVNWKAIWSSGTNLVYVAIEVSDDIAGAVDNAFNELYRDDCLEIFVDGDNAGGTYYMDNMKAQQWFIRRDNTINLGYTGDIAYTGSTINSAIQDGDNGNWILELSMAIYDNYPSDIRPLDTNDIIGWDVWYDDSDNTVTDGGKWDRDHQVGWGYIGPAFYNANVFQELRLGPAITTPQDIAVDPISHNYRSVEVGSSGDQTFTIRNQGGSDLYVSSITLTGTDAMDFSIQSGNGSFTLTPGASHNVIVRFNPASTGTKSAKLIILSNDADESNVTVNLSGTGVSPGWSVPITISGNGQTFTRTIGGNAQATNGYDQTLDVVATPPGMTYYSYLQLDQFPYYLSTDIRPWLPPYNTELTWALKIVNASNIVSILNWNPAHLPAEGTFILSANSIQVNMRTETSTVVSNNDAIVITYSKDYSYTFHFPQQGWYLISLPVTPTNNALQSLFPCAFQAYKYNPLTKNYDPVTTLEPGVGYWLMVMSSCTATVTGTPLRTMTKTYNTGWHLIGTVVGTTNFTTPNDSPDGAIIGAYGYDSATRQYFDVYPPGTGELEQGNGYWIAVLAPCTLVLGGNENLPVAENDFVSLSSFRKIHGELPPAPPAVITNEQPLVKPVTELLIHNYPNPFNPETTIEYHLPNEGFTQIAIYNSLGQKIRTLVATQHSAGIHSIVWNGTDDANVIVANGIYFVKVIHANNSQTRKILMLK